VLANFLTNHPIPAEWELSDGLPNKDVLVIDILPPWKMYFDGVVHRKGAGAGWYSLSLREICCHILLP
jgi:hypothetical protein